MGISLSASNLSDNHYQGSINRMGRALAEAKSRDAIVDTILFGLADDQLDSYNKVRLYFLIANMPYFINDEIEKQEFVLMINSELRKLPAFLSHELDGK